MVAATGKVTMAALWIALLVVGLGVAIRAADRVVAHATAIAFAFSLPPFLVGITLVGIGTDLPEIANSIIASIQDKGDINVGDSIGSAVTQATLVLGIIPFAAGAMRLGRRRVPLVGSLTTAGLIVGAFTLWDGALSRLDGLLLVSWWLGASVVLWRRVPPGSEPTMSVPTRRRSYHVVAALVALTLVGIGAAVAVTAFVELADLIGVPVFLLSFFGQSVGTSLPELTVALTAARQGESDLALGNILGASLADATLSMGVGPLIAPTVLAEPDLALRAAVAAAAVLALVTVLLSANRHHTRVTGAMLVLIYAAFYPLLLAG